MVDTRDASRAPMLAGLLSRRASMAGIALRACSAGTRAGAGQVHPAAVDVAAARGVDLSHHTPTLLEPAHLETDLVLAVTREHARAVLAMDRTAWPRTFTVRELVRRGTGVGGPGRHESLEDWLTRVAGDRRTSTLAGSSPTDDIADLGAAGASTDAAHVAAGASTDAAHVAAGRELDALAGRIVSLLVGR